MDLGEKIRVLRIKSHLTQEELAKKLNTSKQTIGKYEKGIVTNLPLNRVYELAMALNTTPAYLLDWEEYNKKPAPKIEDGFTDYERAILAGYHAAPDNVKQAVNTLLGVSEHEE